MNNKDEKPETVFDYIMLTIACMMILGTFYFFMLMY